MPPICSDAIYIFLALYQIKSQRKNSAFTLFKQEWGVLFQFGAPDICIKKKNQQNSCYCDEKSL